MNAREKWLIKKASEEGGFVLSMERPCPRTYRAALKLTSKGITKMIPSGRNWLIVSEDKK